MEKIFSFKELTLCASIGFLTSNNIQSAMFEQHPSLYRGFDVSPIQNHNRRSPEITPHTLKAQEQTLDKIVNKLQQNFKTLNLTKNCNDVDARLVYNQTIKETRNLLDLLNQERKTYMYLAQIFQHKDIETAYQKYHAIEHKLYRTSHL